MITQATSPSDLDYKRKIAYALMQQGMDTFPVQHWTQGAARALQGALGGYEMHRAERDDKEETAKANAMLAALWGGGAQPAAPAAPAPAPPMPGTPNARVADGFAAAQPASVVSALSGGAPQNAIASIESGGKYDKLGPVISSGHQLAGDRAYGKYQVMGTNVGPWTEKYLGQRMTPEQFVASPEAQEAVFQGEFGRLSQKYGPEGASRAWFAGEGGMNKPNRADQLGTTVQAYGNKFVQAGGDQSLPPNAQLAGPASMPQAAPVAAPSTPNREAIIQLLNNRKTAPFAQSIISNQISQQFKPSEYDFKERPDGTLVAVDKKNPKNVHVVDAPGAGQAAIDYKAREKGAVTKAEELAKREVAAPDKRKQEVLSGGIVTQDIDRAIKEMDTATLPTTGAVGAGLSVVGGTAARNVRGLIDTVKANAGFAELAKMRAASPTGGALGAVTEKELAMLQATIGNLEQSQTEAQLKDNLRRVKNVYLDIIHGAGNGDREKLGFEQPPAAGGTGGTTKSGVKWSVQ